MTPGGSMTSSASSMPHSGKCRKFPVEIRSVNLEAEPRRRGESWLCDCFIRFQSASHFMLLNLIWHKTNVTLLLCHQDAINCCFSFIVCLFLTFNSLPSKVSWDCVNLKYKQKKRNYKNSGVVILTDLKVGICCRNISCLPQSTRSEAESISCFSIIGLQLTA